MLLLWKIWKPFIPLTPNHSPRTMEILSSIESELFKIVPWMNWLNIAAMLQQTIYHPMNSFPFHTRVILAQFWSEDSSSYSAEPLDFQGKYPRVHFIATFLLVQKAVPDLTGSFQQFIEFWPNFSQITQFHSITEGIQNAFEKPNSVLFQPWYPCISNNLIEVTSGKIIPQISRLSAVAADKISPTSLSPPLPPANSRGFYRFHRHFSTF